MLKRAFLPLPFPAERRQRVPRKALSGGCGRRRIDIDGGQRRRVEARLPHAAATALQARLPQLHEAATHEQAPTRAAMCVLRTVRSL